MAPFPPISRTAFQIPESLTLFNSLLQSDLGDKELRLIGWNNLKQNAPIGPLNIPKMMQEVEQEVLYNGKPLIDNVHELFSRFTEKLRPDFKATQLPEENFQLTEIHLSALQARMQKLYEDEALGDIWYQRLLPLFQEQGAFQDVATPDEIEDIRAWLNNPANAERINQVTALDLARLSLKALPSEIGLFIGLQRLNLSENQLSSLPESFGNLRALNWLYLHNNQLNSLLESFGNLRALNVLNLCNNQLSSLPDSFGNLLALNVLYLSNNQLSNLPESFGNLTALTQLSLSVNQLSSLPESLGNLTALTTLDLSNNQLSSLPEAFDNLRALNRLYLSNNQLSSLPESFGNLTALTSLALSVNQLSSLPESFGKLTALTTLDLQNNHLSSLPESLGNLTALTTLYLYNNQLSSLPESLGNLTALTTLDLLNNQLSYLPESFGNLSALTSLNLSVNQLSSLPESFSNLQGLTYLSLYNNQLSYIPELFGNLRALNWLYLNGNPWMLVSDKERSKITDYRTYLAQLDPLKKYTPQSPLATLFHAIIFNKLAEQIQKAYAQLSPEMQQRIAVLVAQNPTYSGPDLSKAASSSAASSSSDPSPGQDDLFTDMGLFARSVRKAAFDHFESLTPDQKNGVYNHIWDLAGRPETDSRNWGEHHVFDHVLRFTDALARITPN